jgi:hypothetical protein
LTNISALPVSATLTAARGYAARGWYTFPVHGWDGENCTCGDPACGNPGKHPATRHGLKDACLDGDRLVQMWRLGWNVAIRTGPESGVFVVDVDGAPGAMALEELERRHGSLPATLEATTARGRHIFFTYPAKAIKTRVAALGQGLDVRGAGGYVVAAPSLHASGAVYSWANDLIPVDAPDWLIDMAAADWSRPAPAARPLGTWQREDDNERWSSQDVREMLTAIPADLIYDDWVHIGMALHEGGYPLALWDEWSRRGEKYRPGDCVKRWGGFNGRDGITMGTLVDQARLYGWKPPQREPMRIEDHPARVFLERVNAAWKARTAAEKVEAVTTGRGLDVGAVDGLIGETAQWIVDTAIKPQPELALLNVLAALGAVYGRRYASPINTRTNIYMVGVAATGSGKDHSRRQIKSLMVAAGMEDLLGGDGVVSAAGIGTLLQKTPSTLLMLDEFGMLLQSISDEKSGAHLKGISKTLTELYSSSSSVYKGGQYADSKRESVVITQPNLCIYGTTTVGEYTKALKRRAIESGELNRFIVVPTSEDYPDPRETMESMGVPDRLVEAWASLRPKVNGLQGSMIVPQPTVVLWGDCKDRMFQMLKYEHEEMKKAQQFTGLWHRYRENCIKIAMILAITRAPMAPQIRHADLDFAETLVQLNIEFMRNLVGDYVAESQHEDNSNTVMRLIKKAGAEGVRGRDLKRATRYLDKKQFESVLGSLLDQERIVAEASQGRGSPSMVYRVAPDE